MTKSKTEPQTSARVRYAIRETLGLVVMAVALFGSAGRLDWWAAWAVLAVMAAWIAATASNTFFSQVVRIQTERGHTVATGSPYHHVRHPAYAGAILYEQAVPVLLASWPALIVSSLNALLLILRTALEDRTLQGELTGYQEYVREVRYRLIPGIW